jgi:GGDEF domain-containing protein
MENFEAGLRERREATASRIANKDLFLFFLDHEVKRARRYQNFLSLLLVRFKQTATDEGNGNRLQTFYAEMCDFLGGEMRESDVLYSLGANQLVILLPYADESAGKNARLRLEDIIKDYDFKSRGFEVMIEQICFPAHGTATIDLIKKTLEAKPSKMKGPRGR